MAFKGGRRDTVVYGLVRRGSVAAAGYQACSVPQCGQSTEVVTAAWKA